MVNGKELTDDIARGVDPGVSEPQIDSNGLTAEEFSLLVEDVVADLETADMLSAAPKRRMNYREIFERDQARKSEHARLRRAEMKAVKKAADNPAKEARKRERATARQQRRRASLKPPEIAKTYVKPTVDVMARERDALRAWVVEDGPRQRQWRPHVEQIMRERVMLLDFRAKNGRDPSYQELADLVTDYTTTAITADAARRRYGRLIVLETLGPWAPAPVEASST